TVRALAPRSGGAVPSFVPPNAVLIAAIPCAYRSPAATSAIKRFSMISCARSIKPSKLALNLPPMTSSERKRNEKARRANAELVHGSRTADAELIIKPGVSTFMGEGLKKMKPPGNYRVITPRVLEQSVKECADLVAEALGLTRQV